MIGIKPNTHCLLKIRHSKPNDNSKMLLTPNSSLPDILCGSSSGFSSASLCGGLNILNAVVMFDDLVHHVLDISLSLLSLDGSENDVHIFKSAALGLLDEKEYEDAVGHTEDAEHDECFPANVVDRAGCHVCDGEVEQPLSRGCHTDTVGPKACWEDF